VPLNSEEAHHRITELIACRWSLAVLQELRSGPVRPGEIRRRLDGITPKVLHARLNKLIRYGLAERRRFDSDKGLHAEYGLTQFGRQVADAFVELNRLAQLWPDSEMKLQVSPASSGGAVSLLDPPEDSPPSIR
jgi:DNA-binding HxlR family transcriptional regulator